MVTSNVNMMLTCLRAVKCWPGSLLTYRIVLPAKREERGTDRTHFPYSETRSRSIFRLRSSVGVVPARSEVLVLSLYRGSNSITV